MHMQHMRARVVEPDDGCRVAGDVLYLTHRHSLAAYQATDNAPTGVAL